MITEIERILIEKGIQESKPLLKRVFSDYLGLFSYLKIKFRRIRKRSIREYEGSEALWAEVLGLIGLHQLDKRIFPNDVVTLCDAYISEWGSISPGKYHLRETWEKNKLFNVPNTLDEFIKKVDDKMIDKNTGYWCIKKPDFGIFMTALTGSSLKYNDKMNPINWGEASVRLDKFFDKSIFFLTDRLGGVNLGFPAILSIGAKNKIIDMIQKYGVAHVESITGIISEIPKTVSNYFDWEPHIPKYCILVDSPLLIKHVGTPKTTRANAWTIFQTKNHGEVYCWDQFDLGNEDYEYDIIESVNKINSEISDEKRAIFDFDEKTTRFKHAYFTPTILKKYWLKYLPP